MFCFGYYEQPQPLRRAHPGALLAYDDGPTEAHLSTCRLCTKIEGAGQAMVLPPSNRSFWIWVLRQGELRGREGQPRLAEGRREQSRALDQVPKSNVVIEERRTTIEQGGRRNQACSVYSTMLLYYNSRQRVLGHLITHTRGTRPPKNDTLL